MIGQLFKIALFEPLFNLLIFFYSTVAFQDMGLAIILLTIFIKIILYPLSLKALRSQQAMLGLNPKIAELKEKYASKKEELAKALVALYREEKVNPFSSILLIIFQIPFLIAVYMVFTSGLGNADLGLLYSFVQKPEHLNLDFLGIFNLKNKSIYFALAAAFTQFWQAKMFSVARPAAGGQGSKDEELTAIMNKQMIYFAPALTVIIGARLPSGLSLYWAVSNLLTIVQQYLLFRGKQKNAAK